jgi:cytochrome P450
MTEPKPADRVPLDEIDLYDPERYRSGSQHPAWHTLRAEAPVWAQSTPDGTRFWSATRHADVARILMDDKRFSSEHGTILAVTGGDSAGGKTINLMDQPKHARVRLPTMRTMSTHLMRQRTERVRANVRQVVAGIVDSGGQWDVAELMLDLPMAAVGEIIGIPRDLWPALPRWAMAGVAPADPYASLSASVDDTLKKAHYELFAVFSDLVRQRRRRRADDLISMLLDIDFGGRPMDEHEVLLNCYSFAMGAITTTPHVASHWVLAMIEQPDAWRLLRANPRLVPDAVEEALRWASPTNHLMRRTRARVAVGDTWLDEGELICAWVASANRDESVFADPYRFRPDRAVNPHLAFGIGAHRCIGGPPAQVVLAVLMKEIIRTTARMEFAGEVRHLASNFINGITSLPVIFHPAGDRVS